MAQQDKKAGSVCNGHEGVSLPIYQPFLGGEQTEDSGKVSSLLEQLLSSLPEDAELD